MATQAGVQSRLFLIYGTTAYCSACGRAALIGASGAHPGSSLAQPGRPLRCRMPISLHVEKHFLSPALVRDIVIGMADGLTVPFALAAGLSGAVSSTAIIVTAGLAEIAAGAIAMALGGYLAALTDLEHYQSEQQREIDEIAQVPETECSEVRHILCEDGHPTSPKP
jgi:VIT1/CCC1 family predicted Fe2+/Mn2+ transporter